ncbi:mucin-binding protein [Lacticaseibacillus zhaodongensis]|uniref:mucin-binding protein n=1 Tax=Lacticaseibacillus zhaodongensis TaxID=2668065 RepID=UPI0012D2A257|nr:MucBP domain-containing protein [Lacticaseibacillus zhaodongensis]
MKTKNNIVERKVRYRMYKDKHGWVIAGVVIATFAVTNIGSHVHSVAAATTDPAEEQTAANTQQADKVVTKTITRTIHYVGADGASVSPDTVQSVTLSQDAHGTWHAVGASAFAAVSAPTVAGQTADMATVVAATPSATDSSSAVTVHYIKTANALANTVPATSAQDKTTTSTDAAPDAKAAAPATTANTTTNEPAGTITPAASTTDAGTKAPDTAVAGTEGSATQSATSDTATNNTDGPNKVANQAGVKKAIVTSSAAPKVEYKSLNDNVEAISVQVDGKDVDTVTDTYDGIFNINPSGNTPKLHTVTIAATDLKKDDVITITTPAFQTVSRADVVNGLNKSTQGQTVNYTATADNSTVKFSIDVSTNSAPMQNVNQGQFTVALNNKVAKSVAVQTTYNMHPLDSLDYDQYTTQGDNAAKTVSTNEEFASEFDSYYSDPIPLTDVNDYTYTIPVPDGFVLDPSESNQLENERNHASIFDFSQSAPGADVVAKLNIGAAIAAGYTNANSLDRSTYFVGKLTTDGTGTATATAKATATISTKYGSVTKEANTPMTVQRADPTKQPDAFQVSYQNKDDGEVVFGSGTGKVYVGPNDVNQYNVNQRGMIYISKNTTGDQGGAWTVSVPDGLSSKSILINADVAQRDRGLDATISAVDADGNELATVGLNQLNYDKNDNIVWDPTVNGSIKKYVLKVNKMVNSSFGTVGIDPNLTTNALPATDTAYHVDVSYQDASGTTKQLDGTKLTLTPDHTIYQQDNSIDAPSHTVQAGDEFEFRVDPFFDAGQQTYVNADEGVILYVRLPTHATYEKTDNFNNNTSVLTEADGTQYLKIAVPAGYSLNNAANGRASSNPIVNNIWVTMKVNSDVVVGDDPTLAPDDYGQVLIGMPNNQIDETFWNRANGKTLTPAAVAANGDTVVAQDAEALGLNKLYAGNNNINTTAVWKLSVPTTLYLTNGIKADGEPEYVADDSGVATFYPDDDKNTGVIRAYVYNGTSAPINNYTTMVTLPSKNDGAAYTLQLTGGVTDPAGATVKYSTNTYTVTDGTPLTAAQTVDFQDASAITDWSKVRSVLVEGNTVPAATALDVEMPVKVTDTQTGQDAAVTATAYTYANDTGGAIVGARITQLPTQVRTQRMVTVEYVDQAGNSLMNSHTLKGDVGAKITLTAPEIAGYKPEQATQDFTYIDSNNEVVKFIYDKTQMQVQVAYINKLTGANIKNANLTPLYGSTVDLTGDAYTKVAGYTTDNNNPKSYQVTNAQKQLVQLYFTPQQSTLTVKYQTTDVSGKTVDLLPADTQTGTVGTTVTIVAKAIAGYVPSTSKKDMTFSAGSSTYVFNYKQLQLPLVVKYQSEDGTKLGDDAQTNVAAGQPYDLNALGLVHSFTGYVLTDNSKSLLTGTAAYDKDTVKLTNGTITLVYNKLAKQRAVVNYLDETAHVALGADQLSGVSGTTIAYDAQARIDSYTRQGYKLISNGFPAGAKYDADDKTAQIFVVRLEHATKDEQVTTHVQRTITYVVAGGKASAPATKVETVDFTRTDTIDQVTSKAVASGPSTPASQTFAAVDTPALTGYVPDIATVAAQTVKPDQKNIAVTVTYHALQKATITYVDKTTGTTLKTDQVTGAPGAAIDYNPQAAIQTYLDQHYDLLKSDFAADSKFDTDDASTQAFTVVLLHTTSQKTVTTPVTRTINYVVADGGVAAPASVTQTVNFTQTVITDNVTGKQIAITQPNPAALTLPAQQSPVLNGYGTDMFTVPAQTVQLGAADTTVTVT